MGIHEFVKTAGEALAKAQESRADEAAKYIEKKLASHDGEIRDLRLDFNNDSVNLHGKCTSHSIMEKVIMFAGNINGVLKVNSDGLEVIGVENSLGNPVISRFYTIKKGDTLSRIAKEFYGDSTKYKQIFKENKGIIKDPDSLYPGLVIRIPHGE